jgi:hypothetical protein
MHVCFELTGEQYLRSCARIRNISMQALIIRLLETIAEDQLVGSILDDDAAQVLRKGERRYREASNGSADYPVPAPR